MTLMTRRRVSPFLLLMLLSLSCRTSQDFQAGEVAEKNGRYDEAVTYYSRAVSEDPDNPKYGENLRRAKLRAAEAHALEAVRYRNAGELEAALRELDLALAMNPTDANLAAEMERIQRAIQERDAAAALTSIENLKLQARETPLGRLSLAPGAEQPAGLLFREANL
ncbi:MAG: tetratricopeptide repeat protein, partial [Vicinamibacteria bacterium]